MSDETGLLAMLRQLIAGDGQVETPDAAPSQPHGEDSPPPGCGDVDEISCQEAVQRVYEYLDSELGGEKAEEVRCHVEKCQRCYPMYNWEQMFLDFLQSRASRAESDPELRRKVETLLDREDRGGRA